MNSKSRTLASLSSSILWLHVHSFIWCRVSFCAFEKFITDIIVTEVGNKIWQAVFQKKQLHCRDVRILRKVFWTMATRYSLKSRAIWLAMNGSKQNDKITKKKTATGISLKLPVLMLISNEYSNNKCRDNKHRNARNVKLKLKMNA